MRQGNDVTFPQGAGNHYALQLSGSGTFITSKGDILTADHVVNPPKDQTLSQFLDQQAAQDVANYINQNEKPGSPQVTPDQVNQELTSGQLKSTPQYNSTTSEVFLSTDYTGPLSAPDFASLPAQDHATVDKIEKESAVDQKDVAIVHAPFNDMPSVQLGDSSTVQQQDQLSIIGFPGNGDVSTKPTDLLTSSVNRINVSSIKTTDSGAPVIQVGGNVEHGDSGGPALDSNGTVVGIVSFGLSSPDSPGGTSFLQASNSAQELVQALHLDTTPGPFQQQWNKAFNTYASTTPGHWHSAQQQFAKIATNYPLFAAITPYQNYANAQAAKEPATQPTQSTQSSSSSKQSTTPITLPAIVGKIGIAGTVGIIVVPVLLILLLFSVVLRRRKKKTETLLAKSKPQPVATTDIATSASQYECVSTALTYKRASIAPI